jgi:hypothetical protein
VSAESRHWPCRVCKEPQETIDTPRLQVCDRCLWPVANLLCRDALGVNPDHTGVDREHWMRAADRVVGPMLERWVAER